MVSKFVYVRSKGVKKMRTKKHTQHNQMACFEGIQEMLNQQRLALAFQSAVRSKPFYVNIDQQFSQSQTNQLK